MLKIKRLYTFMLQTFLPMFFMTFGISLFVLLMQFVWRYVDEIVGKGLDMSVLAQLFFYAALTFVPMAMPLGVLLASLMTFGNLGERFELLAMKASGISLLRIMRPLIIVSILISILSFVFLNNVIPVAQVKMYTLLYSIREKSPEVEIPEGVFYKGIPGVNVYVDSKDRDTGLFLDMLLYDYSAGFENARVILADSGRLKMSADRLYYILSLYSGESFENLQSQTGANRRSATEAVPYRRESFVTKDILIEYDENFEVSDESFMQNQYIGKNLASLSHSIDSMSVQVDSVKQENALNLYNMSYVRTLKNTRSGATQLNIAGNTAEKEEDAEKLAARSLTFQQAYDAKTAGERSSLLNRAKQSIESTKTDYLFRSMTVSDDAKRIIRHYTEMHKKFTSSVACLLFFFIGAPLGAIIRKGGLGTPVVISVLLFIFYYVIDTLGFKMARDAIWEPWEGMWLSAFVLFPLGIFLTYKAVKDSTLLDADTYLNAIKKVLGVRSSRKLDKKDVIIYVPDYNESLNKIAELDQLAEAYLKKSVRWPSYIKFWRSGGRNDAAIAISEQLEAIIEELSNSDRILVLNKLMDYPIVSSPNILGDKVSGKVGLMLAILLPIGIPVFLIAVYRMKLLNNDVRTIRRVNRELTQIIHEQNN